MFGEGGLSDLLKTGDFEYQEEFPLANVIPDENQPRRNVDEKKVQDIIQTLEAPNGRIWQPILIDADEGNLGHKIIFGERRYVASLAVGRKTIPALIMQKSASCNFDNKAKQILTAQLLENSARKDLDIREDGRAYRQLIDQHGSKRKEIAEAIGKSNSHVTEAIMMSEMEEDITLSFLNELYESGELKSATTMTKLIRIARKNNDACKRLVTHAIENDCLTRKWVDSLTNADLSNTSEIILSMGQREELERSPKLQAQPPQGMTDSDDNHLIAGVQTTSDGINDDKFNSTDVDNDDKPLNDETDHQNSEVDKKEKGKKEKGKKSNDKANNSDTPNDDDKKYETVKNCHVTVLYKDKIANLLLNRRDKEEGYAWIELDEEELRVNVDKIKILNVG